MPGRSHADCQRSVAPSRRPDRRRHRARGMLSIFILTGCATQIALRDAQTLSASGQVEAALGKYQEALNLDPNNAELRTAYAQARERATRTFLEQADRLLEAGRRDESEKLYRRALGIDPRNDRARSGFS